MKVKPINTNFTVTEAINLLTNGCKTHCVFKSQDILDALTSTDIVLLLGLFLKIKEFRRINNKNENPKYHVCNTDEPYSDKVEQTILCGEKFKKYCRLVDAIFNEYFTYDIKYQSSNKLQLKIFISKFFPGNSIPDDIEIYIDKKIDGLLNPEITSSLKVKMKNDSYLPSISFAVVKKKYDIMIKG